MENVRKTLKKYYFREIVVYFLVYTMFFSPAVALANPNPPDIALPTGGVLVPYAGSTGWVDPGVNRLDVRDVSNGAVFQWNTFDIGALRTVEFHQLGINPAVLNQVLATDLAATGINGNLLANGRVFIVNPRGIVFGPSAYIEASQLVASSLLLNDITFRNHALAGAPLQFTPHGFEGKVEVRAGADLLADSTMLVGKNVENKGTIVAGPGEYVVMAAGESVLINEVGGDVFVDVAMTTPANHKVDNGGLNGTGTGTVTGGKVILAAGDIFSTAISGIESLAAEADRDITLNGAVTAEGDITLVADADLSGGVDGGDVDAQALTAGGTIDISASDTTTIKLHDDVTADVDILLNNNTVADDGITLDAGDDVVLAAGKTLTGNGTLTVEASDDILLGAGSNPGDVTVAGDLTLDAGHSIEVAHGGSITAGYDVFILGLLKALGHLGIEATNGAIYAPLIFMSQDYSNLSVTQHDSLNVEVAFDNVLNMIKTNLNATSTGGSVTSTDASSWYQVGADAHTFVKFNDNDTGGNIHVSGATADTGDVLITSNLGKVYIDGYVGAGQDVKITAKNESSDSIILDDISNMNAGRDILLNNNTYAYQDITFSAGRDFKLGYDEIHDVYYPKTLTGDEGLTVEAGRDITLGGAVTASDDDYGGDLILHADYNFDGVGNVHAMSTLTNWEDDIHISGRTVDLDGAVWADWDLTVVANEHPAYEDNEDNAYGNVTAKSTLHAGGNVLSITADDNIDLQDAVEASWGDITLVADADGFGVGSVDAEELTAGGSVTISASDDTINLHDDVLAGGDITLHNDTVADAGITLDAGHDVHLDDSKTLDGLGNLTVEADHDVYLGGAVTTAGKMHIGADRNLFDNGDVIAKGTLTANGDVAGTSMVVTGNYITLEQDATAAGNMILTADRNLGGYGKLFVQGKLTATDGGDIEMDAGYDSTFGGIFLQYNGVEPEVEAAGDIILHEDTEAVAGVVLAAGDDVVLVAGQTLDGLGDLTVEADDDIMFGVAAATHEAAPTSGTAGDVSADGTLIVDAEGSVYAHGTITTTSGGDIEIYSSDSTTFLYGDYINAGGSILLDNTTESYGDIIAGVDVTMNGTVELKGTGADQDQEITATTGSLYANDWVHKTSTGNLDMFGGSTLGTTSPYSVHTREVRAEDGELNIHGNGYVRLHGDIYSSGDMRLAANEDGSGPGYLWHSLGGTTIESEFGEIDMSATDDTIYLYGGTNLTDPYVSAADDILLRDDTLVYYSRKLHAGDDIVLAGGEQISGNYSLTLEADNDIILGVTNVDTHESSYATGSNGDVTAYGDLILTAGDDIWAHGTLSTGPGTGGAITATAVDDIRLYETGTSADADGTLTLTADSDDNKNGNLTVNGDLYGNMDLSGYDVTVDGIVDSEGVLDVHADDDIKLKSDVSSVDEMTMNAGDNIELNRSSGNTSSESTITLTAGDDITIGKSSGNEGNVTADGHMGIFAGDDRYDDVKVYGKLTTTEDSEGDITVTAGDDIRLYGTWSDDVTPVYESAEADGTLTLTADTSGNGSLGGDLEVDGSLVGNMALSGTDVTVDGDVTSFGILTVDADDDIRLKSNVISSDAMTMNAGDNIWLNENGDYTSSGDTMTLNAGLKYDGSLHPDFDFDEMSGSIKIEGYASSKEEMIMNAFGGGIIGLDLILNDLMNGSIYIQDYAYSQGEMTLTAVGNDEIETLDFSEIVLMNGSIKIGDYAESVGDMAMSATGGSEGIDLLIPDLIDFDGMNGSIKIGDYAESTEGGITMTADGGCEFLTNDTVDVDLMDGSIKIGGDIISLLDMELSAHGGSELLTKDTLDVDGLNGSILICGNAEAREGGITMTAIGGSEFLTCDKFDIDGMNGSILVGGSVESQYDIELCAVGGSEFLTADKVDIDGMNGSILINNGARSYGGSLSMTAIGGSEFGTCDLIDFDAMNGSIKINNFVESMLDMDLMAIGGSEFCTFDVFDAALMNGSIFIDGYAKTYDGDMTLKAIGGSEFRTFDLVDAEAMNGSIKISDYAESVGDMTMTAIGGSEFRTADLLDLSGMNGSIKVDGYLRSHSDMTLTAIGGSDFGTCDLVDIDLMNGSIFLTGTAESDGDMTLRAVGGREFCSVDHCVDFSHFNGDVVALSDLTSNSGSIEIYSSDDTTYLGGDVKASVDVLLNNNTRFIGYGDQKVTAQTGTITANGWLDKSPFYHICRPPTDGSLYLHAEGDISLANYVTAADNCFSGGGVRIISDNGRIYTPADSPDPEAGDYVLNVDITGRSDHHDDVGVDLPFGGEDSGKAAIVVMSGENLNLGPDGKLSAYGRYYDDVDDRVGVGFLAAPATIGDVPRNEGDLFDAAIYVASKGDVDVSSPVSILSLPVDDLINGRPECEPRGAMIVDAVDTVTFDAALGGQFLASLANGDVGDRLEVCSRITEWLFQAVGRLPFAAAASAMSTLWYGNPDSYILRGAGLDNPAITDGRAWVLENPAPPAPLYREAGEPAEEQEFAEGGCPALMEWLAVELGIEEDIQIFVANTFAYSTDIQPCEICARLRDAATILEDPEGAGVAALAQVVNEFVAPDVPPSAEQMTLIAAAFAEHVGDGTYYAAAGQWIDAVAAYVGILNIEMGYSADDSAAFAGKYVAPVTETGNASLITYVEARLAALGG